MGYQEHSTAGEELQGICVVYENVREIPGTRGIEQKKSALFSHPSFEDSVKARFVYAHL